MNKKVANTMRIILIIGICVALIVVLKNAWKKYSFSELVGNKLTENTVCTIDNIDKEQSITLNEVECRALLTTLESTTYSNEGSYDNLLYGSLYHIYFVDVDTNQEICSIIISDEGKLYTSEKKYGISSEEVVNYIDMLYE